MKEFSAEELVGIWCVKTQVKYWDNPNTYLHLFECPIKKSTAEIGIRYSGYCETCYHEYPCIKYTVICECGEITFKDYEITSTYDLSSILNAIDEIGKEIASYA